VAEALDWWLRLSKPPEGKASSAHGRVFRSNLFAWLREPQPANKKDCNGNPFARLREPQPTTKDCNEKPVTFASLAQAGAHKTKHDAFQGPKKQDFPPYFITFAALCQT